MKKIYIETTIIIIKRTPSKSIYSKTKTYNTASEEEEEEEEEEDDDGCGGRKCTTLESSSTNHRNSVSCTDDFHH